MKILLVDDSSMIRKIIRGAVEVLGYESLEATDGQEALLLLEKERKQIGLILLDWNMPGMNGIDLLKTIKNDPNYSKIPVMMVTTESERENIIMAIKTGASNYMTKPFTMEELTKKILESLGEG